jgi:precorrin-3B synthase
VPVLHPNAAPAPTAARQRADRCPGLTRPWIAADGALVRIRLVGGALSTVALAQLAEASREYGDGDLHLTGRANLQVRGVRHLDGAVPDGLVDAVRRAGLLPSDAHDLVRNVMVSPLAGRIGGLADLRPVARELDRLLVEDPACADLAGRFLFVLDDGRGDLVGRTADLAAVAVDARTVQLRAGTDQWGEVVTLAEAARGLHALTRRFLELRGEGPTAAWHVDELDGPLLPVRNDKHRGLPSEGAERCVESLAAGWHQQDDGRFVAHLPAPDGRLTPQLLDEVLATAGDEVVVTPWRSVLLPDLEAR